MIIEKQINKYFNYIISKYDISEDQRNNIYNELEKIVIYKHKYYNSIKLTVEELNNIVKL